MARSNRAQARSDLANRLRHQGTSCEASAHAVPFVAALACDPTTPDRHDVVGLLAWLAVGLNDEHLPYGYDIAAHRHLVAEINAQRTEPPDQRAIWSHQENALNSYDLVRLRLPRLRHLTYAPEPGVRSAIAFLLAWFPEEAGPNAAALLGMLDIEHDAAARANAAIALGLLEASESIRHLRSMTTNPDACVRWAAAMALARLGEVNEAGVALITERAGQPHERMDDAILFHYGEIAIYSAKTLRAFVPGAPAYIPPNEDPWA